MPNVAWRAQLLGWKCLYTPLARAYHVRSVLPVNRRSVSSAVNMHSVKKSLAAPYQKYDWAALPPLLVR